MCCTCCGQLEKAKITIPKLTDIGGSGRPKTVREIDELDERLTTLEEEVRGAATAHLGWGTWPWRR